MSVSQHTEHTNKQGGTRPRWLAGWAFSGEEPPPPTVARVAHNWGPHNSQIIMIKPVSGKHHFGVGFYFRTRSHQTQGCSQKGTWSSNIQTRNGRVLSTKRVLIGFPKSWSQSKCICSNGSVHRWSAVEQNSSTQPAIQRKC